VRVGSHSAASGRSSIVTDGHPRIEPRRSGPEHEPPQPLDLEILADAAHIAHVGPPFLRKLIKARIAETKERG